MPTPPKPPVCDFCGEPEPNWSYPCASGFQSDDLDPPFTNEGSWLACDGCAVFIETDNRETLAARAAFLIVVRNNMPEPSWPDVCRTVAEGHSRFFQNRRGKLRGRL